jgi:hypothetical protein
MKGTVLNFPMQRFPDERFLFGRNSSCVLDARMCQSFCLRLNLFFSCTLCVDWRLIVTRKLCKMCRINYFLSYCCLDLLGGGTAY